MDKDTVRLSEFRPRDRIWHGYLYHWVRNGLNQVEISGYNGDVKEMKRLFVPSAINYRAVVSIGDNAFQRFRDLNCIHFPDTVESIGRDVLSSDHPIALFIPESVGHIDDDAFSSCAQWGLFFVKRGSYAEKYCGALRLRYSYYGEDEEGIPSRVSLLDLYGVHRVKELNTWEAWCSNKIWEGVWFHFGLAADSRVCTLNINERIHGPHGLIGGAAGSGKTTALQTIVLSLALNYSPDQLQFVLIDRNGGGLAELAGLPHVAGFISSDQGNDMINHAMAGLFHELCQRERLLRRQNCSHVDYYNEMYGFDPDAVRVPHLVWIVDGFDVLQRENPDAMRELISMSRSARSLGTHLIMAAEDISAAVNDTIWSIAHLHICLGVRSQRDSLAMLCTLDAMDIKTPGRCVVQITDKCYAVDRVQIASPRVPCAKGEGRIETLQISDDSESEHRFIQEQYLAEAERRGAQLIEIIIEHICDTAREHGVSNAKALWVPPMRSELCLGDMQAFVDSFVRGGVYLNQPEEISCLLGMLDDTSNACYIPWTVNLSREGNLLLAGQSGSGKSTAIESMIFSLCGRYDPAHLNIYVVSGEHQSWRQLEELPQVGGWLIEDRDLETQRLIGMLTEEAARRASLFKQTASDSFVACNHALSQRGVASVPAIVLFVDSFGWFMNAFEDSEDVVYGFRRLIKDGGRYGIHVVATAQSMNEIPEKLRSSFSRVAMKQRDCNAYRDVLDNHFSYETLPDDAGPGHALVRIKGEWKAMEVQIGLAGAVPNLPSDQPPVWHEDAFYSTHVFPRNDRHFPDQSERFTDAMSLVNGLAGNWKGPRPESPYIFQGGSYSFESFAGLPEFRRLLGTHYMLPVGIDADKGTVVSIDLEKDYSMLVIGSEKPAITNQLMVIARSLVMRGAEVHVIGGPRWASFCEAFGIALYRTEDEVAAFVDRFVAEVPQVRQRLKKQAEALGLDQVRRQALEFRPYAIIVDDVETLVKGYTDERFTKSPVQLLEEYCQACPASEEAVQTLPPGIAPGQNPARKFPARQFIQGVIGQAAVTAQYYNISVFAGLSTGEWGVSNSEPVKSLMNMKRGIGIGIERRIKAFPFQGELEKRPADRGFMQIGTDTLRLHVPTILKEE